MARDEAKGKFHTHKSGAKHRGIPFLLTFEEWLNIWLQSGHWHERGCRKGQYCMARLGDKGPYAVGNIEIILHTENDRQGKIGNKNGLGYKHTTDAKRRIAANKKGNDWNVGRVHTAQQRLNISRSLRGKPRAPLTEEHRQRIAEGVRRARSATADLSEMSDA